MVLEQVPFLDDALQLIHDEVFLNLFIQFGLLVVRLGDQVLVVQVEHELVLYLLADVVQPNLKSTNGAILGPLLLTVLLIFFRELLQQGSVGEVQICSMLFIGIGTSQQILRFNI